MCADDWKAILKFTWDVLRKKMEIDAARLQKDSRARTRRLYRSRKYTHDESKTLKKEEVWFLPGATSTHPPITYLENKGSYQEPTPMKEKELYPLLGLQFNCPHVKKGKQNQLSL